jgi:hypothetical protein
MDLSSTDQSRATMPSAWIERRGDKYRVRFRVGGHETEKRYAGTFKRMRDAG